MCKIAGQTRACGCFSCVANKKFPVEYFLNLAKRRFLEGTMALLELKDIGKIYVPKEMLPLVFAE